MKAPSTTPVSGPRITRARTFAAGAILAATLAVAPSAHADDVIVTLDQVVYGTAGQVVVLETRDVDAALVGTTCTASYTGENNSSVHPGTDLLISSGAAQLVLSGVEDVAGATTSGSSAILLGPTVSVAVRLGPDAMSSLGATLSLTCTLPTTTTSTTSTTTTTTSPPTTVSSTTTAATATTLVDTTTSSSVAAAGPIVSASSTSSTSPGGNAPIVTGPSALPATGGPSDRLVSVALVSVLLGGLLCLSRRRAAPAEDR